MGRIESGPNSSNAKHLSGQRSTASSMRASLASRSGSLDSFQVLVRWKVTSWACSIWRSRSWLTRTGRSAPSRRHAASLRRLHRVNGRPRASGRAVAVSTMNASSSVVIRRGRPPAQRGSSDAIPNSLNRRIISRTRSGDVAASRAITGTVLPPADASTTSARRQRTTDPSELPLPRRTIR